MATQNFTNAKLFIFSFSIVIAASALSYLDRNALAVLAPTIMKECHISSEQYGYIVSAFSLAYMVANPVWGHILDRVGARWGLSTALLLWTVCSALHGFARNFKELLALRLALGCFQGATFPAAVKSTAILPQSVRGRGIAAAYSGGPIGAILAPILIVPLSQMFGWHVAFLVTGFLGIIWLPFWMRFTRTFTVAQPDASTYFKLTMIWQDSRVWSYLAIYALGGFPLAFILNYGPIYLHQQLGVSQVLIGKTFWLPPLGWACGFYFWGWTYDKLRLKGGSATRIMFFIMIVATLLGLPLSLVPWLNKLSIALLALFIGVFVTPAFVTPPLTWICSLHPKEHAAFLTGLGSGCWSAVVALLAPYIGHLFDIQHYHQAFLINTALVFIGVGVWTYINHGNLYFSHNTMPKKAE
jgi:ACS family hexuronate transporter-like MFS transporter